VVTVPTFFTEVLFEELLLPQPKNNKQQLIPNINDLHMLFVFFQAFVTILNYCFYADCRTAAGSQFQFKPGIVIY
jgi:hypothetical protein